MHAVRKPDPGEPSSLSKLKFQWSKLKYLEVKMNFSIKLLMDLIPKYSMAFYGLYNGYIQRKSENVSHIYPKNILFNCKQTEIFCEQTEILSSGSFGRKLFSRHVLHGEIVCPRMTSDWIEI